jgi:hypothetical protein
MKQWHIVLFLLIIGCQNQSSEVFDGLHSEGDEVSTLVGPADSVGPLLSDARLLKRLVSGNDY